MHRLSRAALLPFVAIALAACRFDPEAVDPGCAHGGAGTDLDGDGRGDVLVGAPGDIVTRGAVYVFGARNGGLPAAEPARVLEDPREVLFGRFGWSVAYAGDVDADGCGDILVGAPGPGSNGLPGGTAYLFFGSAEPTPPTEADRVIEGEPDQRGLGSSVAGAGDLNADGFADFAVRWGEGQPIVGIEVFFGGPRASVDGASDGTILPAECSLGRALAGAGDLDGDGFGELAVIAGRLDETGGCDWRVLVYRGGPGARFDTTAPVQLGGDLPGPCGQSIGDVAPAGDVDGDGFADLVAAERGPDIARLCLFLGGPDLDGTVDSVVEVASESIPPAVAGAGDLDGDGRAEVVMTVQEGDAWFARIYTGGPPFGLLALVTAEAAGIVPWGDIGIPVAAVGDVDGGGVPDLVVGDEGSPNTLTSGTAHLSLGEALGPAPDLTFTGASAAARFGLSIGRSPP